MKTKKLPTKKNKKLLDKEKFDALAMKVREHFEREKEYLKRDNGNTETGGAIIYS